MSHREAAALGHGTLYTIALIALLGCHPFDPFAVILPEDALDDHLLQICFLQEGHPDCPCRGQAETYPTEGNWECELMVRGWISAAGRSALTYGQECAERLVEFEISTAPCLTDASEALSWVTCEDECQIYFGTAAVGESCERFGRRMSTCAADLVCGFDDRCYAPCDRPLEIPAGGACSYASGLLQEQCAPGLLCDPGTGACVVEPLPEASCDPEAPLCIPVDWCDPDTTTCTPRLPLASPCQTHDQCTSLVCDEICEPPDQYKCDHPWF